MKARGLFKAKSYRLGVFSLGKSQQRSSRGSRVKFLTYNVKNLTSTTRELVKRSIPKILKFRKSNFFQKKKSDKARRLLRGRFRVGSVRNLTFTGRFLAYWVRFLTLMQKVGIKGFFRKGIKAFKTFKIFNKLRKGVIGYRVRILTFSVSILT